MLRRERRRFAPPDFQNTDYLVLRHQRDRKSGADAFGSCKAHKVAANNFTLDVVLDRTGFAGLKDSTADTLPSLRAKASHFTCEIASAAFHDQRIILKKHDAADVRGESGLGLVSDLNKDLLEILTLQNLVCHALEYADRFEFIGVDLVTFARRDREPEHLREDHSSVAKYAWIANSFGQESDATNLDRDEGRIIKVHYVCRGVRKAFDQCFVGAVIELLPFAPGAGRSDEKPDIPRRKEISKQNACLSKKLLGIMICSVGERDNRLSQQVERRIGMMVWHSPVRQMHSPPH